jgi:hypothetical protein
LYGIRYREKNDIKEKILIIISIAYSVVKNVVDYKSKIYKLISIKSICISLILVYK